MYKTMFCTSVDECTNHRFVHPWSAINMTISLVKCACNIRQVESFENFRRHVDPHGNQLFNTQLFVIAHSITDHSCTNRCFVHLRSDVQNVVLYICTQMYKAWFCTLAPRCTNHSFVHFHSHVQNRVLYICAQMYKSWFCTFSLRCTKHGFVHLRSDVQITVLYICIQMYKT